jgi:putative transposase
VSIRQRLYPTPGQLPGLVMHADHARFVWNLALEQRHMWRPDHRGRRPVITAGTQMKELAGLRGDLDWLRAGSSSVQQEALRDLDKAYRNWWTNPRHFRAPTWRKASTNVAFYVRDLHVQPLTRRWGRVLVPKVGWVKFRLTRPIATIVVASSARVTFAGGNWHVSFTAPPPTFAREHTGRHVGLDRGVTNTLATSDGQFLHIPALSTGEQTRFLALSRRLGRQHGGSKRRAATKAALARLHTTLANRRSDWVEQTTTALVRTYDLCAIENLRTANMVRRPAPRPDPDQPGAYLPNGAAAKAGLNKAIYASCWAKFATRLTTKAAHSTDPASVIAVNPRGTSQQCNACGHVSAENRQSQADFTCVNCGHVAHADINASKNILARAHAQTQPPDRRGSDAQASRTVSRVNHLPAAA